MSTTWVVRHDATTPRPCWMVVHTAGDIDLTYDPRKATKFGNPILAETMADAHSTHSGVWRVVARAPIAKFEPAMEEAQ